MTEYIERTREIQISLFLGNTDKVIAVDLSSTEVVSGLIPTEYIERTREIQISLFLGNTDKVIAVDLSSTEVVSGLIDTDFRNLLGKPAVCCTLLTIYVVDLYIMTLFIETVFQLNM